MKILLVSDIFYPHPGGVSEHILHLADNLRLLGHEARILAPSYGQNHPWESNDIIRMGRAFKFIKNQSFSVITVGLTLPWDMQKLLQREHFDIIHIQGELAQSLAYFAIKYSQSRNFITFHSCHEGSIGYTLMEPLMEQYFRKIDGLIAVSTVARDSALQHFPGVYRIIPNGVDTRRFHDQVEPRPELKTDNPKILFVGRFEPRKGLKYLFQALPRIKAVFPDVTLVIVGSGILEKYYRQLVEKQLQHNVLFVGNVPREELPRYYASCDIFCSPAIGAESFGIILLEAMAAGKPIVASDIPGYRTILEPGQEGVFCQPCNADDLAEKIIALLREPALRKKMGQQGRAKALQYDWSIITRQVVDYYLEVMNSSRSDDEISPTT